MLALILYIIGALCFIAAVVLLTFIPHKGVRITVLILFCLVFIGSMTFLLFKVSGQNDLASVFSTMSSEAQTTDSTFNIGNPSSGDAGTTPEPTKSPAQSAPPTATPVPTLSPTPTPTPTAPGNIAAGVVGTWVDPVDSGHAIDLYADGTCTIFYTNGTLETGTYTFDSATNSGMMIDGTYSLWYDPQTDTVTYVGGTMVREGTENVQADTFSILRMWYDDDGSGYQLEFNPDGLVRYITPDDVFAGWYTFDEATGQGEIDMFGEIYGITYHTGTKLLGFDGLTYRCTPPGPVTNRILGMWYEQGDGATLIEFFPDGTARYHNDIDPDIGTYVFDDAAGHGDVNMLGYTYEIIYNADTDILSFEGALYSRIPW